MENKKISDLSWLNAIVNQSSWKVRQFDIYVLEQRQGPKKLPISIENNKKLIHKILDKSLERHKPFCSIEFILKLLRGINHTNLYDNWECFYLNITCTGRKIKNFCFPFFLFAVFLHNIPLPGVHNFCIVPI